MTRSQDKRPTLQTIADDLDTSVCTVSRVLNGKADQYRIAKATQEVILKHAKRVEYRPNAAAQSLKLNRIKDVGLILPDFSNPFFAQIAKYVAKSARSRNYSIQVSETLDSIDVEIDAISHMLHRRVEGLIIWPVGLQSEHLSQLESGTTPIVLVDRCFPSVKLPQVSTDNVAASYMATKHLIENGHSKIACLQGLVLTSTNQDRLKGYRQALFDAGLDVDESLIVGDRYSKESGYESARQIISSQPDTTAIVSLSNQNCLGALRAFAELDVHIPDDISIVSFDDIEGVEFFSTPLTVVSQPLEAISQIATRLLFEFIDDERSGKVKHEFVTAELICRNSVKRLS